jgi:hypothetical protein
VQVTYIPVSELDAKSATNPKEFAVYMHMFWASAGSFHQPDNDLCPEWNPSPVIDHVPVAKKRRVAKMLTEVP